MQQKIFTEGDVRRIRTLLTDRCSIEMIVQEIKQTVERNASWRS